MAWFRSRPLRRIALVAIGGLLLNAATPLLADAAATLRGVPVGEICDVWGVRLPDPPVHEHAMSMPAHEVADASMAMSDDASMADHAAMSDAMAMPSDDATADTHDHAAVVSVVAQVEQTAAPHHHSHSHDLHGGCDHCALTAFATFAAIDTFPAALPASPSESHLGVRPFRADATPYDAVTSWVLHLKRGPPRSA
jgi:hypothetical protein